MLGFKDKVAVKNAWFFCMQKGLRDGIGGAMAKRPWSEKDVQTLCKLRTGGLTWYGIANWLHRTDVAVLPSSSITLAHFC